jgi:hypothetical protein
LTELRQVTSHGFNIYTNRRLYLRSRQVTPPRTRQEIGVKKTMFAIFLINRKGLIVEYLPKGQKSNQGHFISDILPELEREKMRYQWMKPRCPFFVDMDHSKSHDGGKIRHERPCTRSASTLFSWPESTRLLVPWNRQGKNEGSEISRRSRYSPPFDGPWNDLTFETSNRCSLSGRSG